LYINYELVLVILSSYIIGSIPFGLLVSIFLKKKDPRKMGSKNIGATNIARISGWKLGLTTLLLDISKAFFAVKYFSSFSNFYLELSILFVFIGHLFPVWLRFNGGKGVAVLIGILLAYNSGLGIIFLVSWAVTALIFKYSSLSALVACAVTLISTSINSELINWVLATVISLIFLKHIENIKRLINGTESKINLKKKN